MNVENKVTNESPLACNMAALSDEQRKRILVLIKQIRAAGQELRELADGYSLRLPAESEMIKDVSEWITLERLCCPFFPFEMEVEQEGGPMWIRLTGAKALKTSRSSSLVSDREQPLTSSSLVSTVERRVHRELHPTGKLLPSHEQPGLNSLGIFGGKFKWPSFLTGERRESSSQARLVRSGCPWCVRRQEPSSHRLHSVF